MRRKNICQEISCSIILSVVIITSLLTSAYAASYYVSFSFNTGGSGNAYVDGYANGKTYNLRNGSATLALTDDSSCFSGGTYRMTLYKHDSWIGLGTYCGTLTAEKTGPNRTHSQTFSIPSDGNKYYFYGTGEGTFNNYAAYGSFIQ